MTKPLPEHRCYDWSSLDHRSIEIRLSVLRDQIAAILQIDPTETETVCIPIDTRPTGRSVKAYIDRRNSPSRVEFVRRIDVALEEIEGALVRFMADLSNLNDGASDNIVRKILESIAVRDDITEEEIELLDLSVRERLAAHYPGGRKNFKPGTVWSELVIEAAQSALQTFEKPKRGRPNGSSNKAAENLGQELLAVFSRYAPTSPSRSVVNKKVKAEIVSRTEGGVLLHFFECVTDALPSDFREHLTKSGGGLAALIRRSLPVST